MFNATIHKNGDVTIFNVFSQQSERRSASDAFSHKSFKALSLKDKARIEALSGGTNLSDNRRLARRIAKAADEGGTLSPEKMLGISSDPKDHTYMSLSRAFKRCGCEYSAALEFDWFGIEDFESA